MRQMHYFHVLWRKILRKGPAARAFGRRRWRWTSLPESPERLLDAVTELLGPLSILVNNAAHSTRDGLQGARRRDPQRPLCGQSTGRGAALGRVRPAFDGETGGRIVNLTSGQSLGSMPEELAYAATKSAIEAFTRTLAAEVGHKGMTVNVVNPDPTDPGWMTGELKQELSAKFSARRVGESEDAARLVAFLASDRAAWITGQIIHSEGGFLRS